MSIGIRSSPSHACEQSSKAAGAGLGLAPPKPPAPFGGGSAAAFGARTPSAAPPGSALAEQQGELAVPWLELCYFT